MQPARDVLNPRPSNPRITTRPGFSAPKAAAEADIANAAAAKRNFRILSEQCSRIAAGRIASDVDPNRGGTGQLERERQLVVHAVPVRRDRRRCRGEAPHGPVDEQGQDVPRDAATVGEIIVRGNVVMEGYYNDPEATAVALRSSSRGPTPSPTGSTSSSRSWRRSRTGRASTSTTGRPSCSAGSCRRAAVCRSATRSLTIRTCRRV